MGWPKYAQWRRIFCCLEEQNDSDSFAVYFKDVNQGGHWGSDVYWPRFLFMNLDVGVGGQITKPRMTQWIQYKLGKQYLIKKFTLPWESNPGPTPIRGGTATLIASVGLKNIFYSQIEPSQETPPSIHGRKATDLPLMMVKRILIQWGVRFLATPPDRILHSSWPCYFAHLPLSLLLKQQPSLILKRIYLFSCTV